MNLYAEYQTQDILVTITYEEDSFYDRLEKDDQRRYLMFIIEHKVRSEGSLISYHLRKRRKII